MSKAKQNNGVSVSYHDLVLDTGELVRITYPECFSDAFFESLEAAMKRRDWWSPVQFGDECKVEFCGMSLGRVAMWRVVGALN